MDDPTPFESIDEQAPARPGPLMFLGGVPLLSSLGVALVVALGAASGGDLWPWGPGEYPGTMNLLLFGCVGLLVGLAMLVVFMALAVASLTASLLALRQPGSQRWARVGVLVNLTSVACLLALVVVRWLARST